MRAAIKFLIPSLAAAFLLAACGSSSSTSRSAPQAAATNVAAGSSALVRTATSAKLGTTILVDSAGMTLYQLSGERNGRFICTSAGCLKIWHPLIAPDSAPIGAVGSLSAARRPGIGPQVTYKGMPLYTFVQDKSPGQVRGQGIKDVGTWAAVPTRTSTAPAAVARPAGPPQPASSGGGGYGY
jgi:predicted lipoprotein with Yx(FWY)xxD motif